MKPREPVVFRRKNREWTEKYSPKRQRQYKWQKRGGLLVFFFGASILCTGSQAKATSVSSKLRTLEKVNRWWTARKVRVRERIGFHAHCLNTPAICGTGLQMRARTEEKQRGESQSLHMDADGPRRQIISVQLWATFTGLSKYCNSALSYQRC